MGYTSPEEIEKRQGANENSPRRAEIKLRKNEMKLRKNDFEVPMNFLMPPWRVSFSSVETVDFCNSLILTFLKL